MFSCAGADDRMRGLLLYHGAGTGRWTGRLIQPQNLPARSKALGDGFKAEAWREPVLAHEFDTGLALALVFTVLVLHKYVLAGVFVVACLLVLAAWHSKEPEFQ